MTARHSSVLVIGGQDIGKRVEQLLHVVEFFLRLGQAAVLGQDVREKAGCGNGHP